jgi:putative N6-adenine-specific DNA methylase
MEQQNFFESEREREGRLHMVFNPPYGERLDVDMPVFYRKIGDALKQNYPNTEAWFITSNLEAIKHVGLRPSRKIKVYNGALESRLLKYEIYEGTKKIHKLKEENS